MRTGLRKNLVHQDFPAESWRSYGVDLPPCTSLEVTDIAIRDPNQTRFATMGGTTRPWRPSAFPSGRIPP
jgi:hypothetical protein